MLVTGAAGFIGSHLVDGLLGAGHEVVAVDNLSTGRERNLAHLKGRIEFLRVDARDASTMRRAMEGCLGVFHHAALPSVPRSIEDPVASNDHNVNATLSVLLAARDAGVTRVVYAGSSSAYGNEPRLPRVETIPPAPMSPYAVAKLAGEMYARVFHFAYGMETMTLRYFNVFGPRQDPTSAYAAVIPRFMSALARGRAPVIHGDGEQTRDFTYVENVVQANLLAMEAPASAATGDVYNVGCGDRTTLNDMLRELQAAAGTNIAPVHAEPRAGDVRDSQADISKARKALGYEPVVKLREGLRRTYEAYLGNPEAAA